MTIRSRRSIFIDPSADGGKAQFTAYGAASDWQALSKPSNRPPNTPVNTSGVRSTTDAHTEQIIFPAIDSLMNPGETVAWLRVHTHFEGAIPANHSNAIGIQQTSGLAGGATGAAGTSGWVSSPKLNPYRLNLGGIYNPAATCTIQTVLTESGAQAANTDITQQVVEVGLTTHEHLKVSGANLVGTYTGRRHVFSYAQYGSVAFDPWMVVADLTNARINLRKMYDSGLRLVRIFIPFGYMMTSETVVNEDRWATFGRWWKRCAQACAKSPAVALYNLMNEPFARNGSGPSWYAQPTAFAYGSSLNLVMSGRTAEEIGEDFYDQMTVEVHKHDPITPTALGHTGDGTGSFAPSGWEGISAENYSQVVLPHYYLSQLEGPLELTDKYRALKALGKPVIVEECGFISQGDDLYSVDTLQALKIRWHHLGALGVQSGWRNALDTYTRSRAMHGFRRLSPVVSGRVPTVIRVAGVRAISRYHARRAL